MKLKFHKLKLINTWSFVIYTTLFKIIINKLCIYIITTRVFAMYNASHTQRVSLITTSVAERKTDE